MQKRKNALTKKELIQKTFFPYKTGKYSEDKYPIYKKDNRTIPYNIIKPKNESPYYILFSHGNAQSLEDIAGEIKFFCVKFGMNVVGYDYAGYGHNKSETNEENILKDIELIYLMLIKEMKIPQENIIIMGHSMGCGPTIGLAKKICDGGLENEGIKKGIIGSVVIISGFTSCYSFFLEHYTDFEYSEDTDIFVNKKNIEGITAPTFIAHGNDDYVIRVDNGKKLFNCIKDKNEKSELLLLDEDHISILYCGEFLNGLRKFFDKYLPK